MGDVIELSSDGEEREKDTEEMKPKDLKKSKCREAGEYDVDSGGIHDAFKKFLAVCCDIEVKRRKGDPVSIARIKDKLLSRFRAADPEYTKSEPFKETLISASKLVETDPSNLFVHMKHIGDELKTRSKKDKTCKRKLLESEVGSSKKAKTSEGESEGEDSGVNKRHVRKLEVLFQKVYRKVKNLEEQEVDFDAEDESSYMQLERYKKRLYKIWEKWQEVRGRMDEVKKLKHRKVAFSGSQYSDLNHAIEKFVNRTKGFPDYLDIYNLTDETLNKEKSGKYTADQIRGIATAVFQNLGNQLQKMRVYDFWNSCQTYLSATLPNVDPADKDEHLAKALQENKVIYKKKLVEVIDKFVDKQVDGKHEAEEVLPGMEVVISESSEEEENPEEIINISSTSEESHGEASEEEHENGEFGTHTNGNMDESSNHSHSSDSKVPSHKFGVAKDGRKVNSCSGTSPIKQSKGCEGGKPTASGSSLSSIKTERPHCDSENHKDQEKTKSVARDDSQEVVILSESDSGD